MTAFRLLAPLALALLAGCAPDRDLGPEPSDGGAPPAQDTGLPCDVAQLLAQRCTGCHSDPPRYGAPVALVTYEQLAAPSPLDAAQTLAQRSVARMKDAARPMPPGSVLPAAEIAVLEGWVQQGAPKGSCGETPDAGTPNDLPDSPPTCTSGVRWTRGNHGDRRMNPGQACLFCHLRSGEDEKDMPTTGFAGTLYPTNHEPNNCNGAQGYTVEVTDATGKVVTATSNEAGNFYRATSLTFPIRARVLQGDRVRQMLSAVPSGDCNGCHTQDGLNGAPGRIVIPAE